MEIGVSYQVDRELYFTPDTQHEITLSTTEYTHRHDMLVHLQVGKNLGIRLNNLIKYEFKKSADFQNEQFFYKKSYNKGNAKPTTRGTFEDKLKRFDMSQTVKEQELVEEYSYKGKNGKSDMVQIVVRIKGDSMTAIIDFKSAEQYQNFIEPAWLKRLSE